MVALLDSRRSLLFDGGPGSLTAERPSVLGRLIAVGELHQIIRVAAKLRDFHIAEFATYESPFCTKPVH